MSSAADGHTDICKQGVGQASFPHYNGKPKQLTLKLYDLSFRWKASTQGQEWWQTCLSYTIKEYFQVGAGQKNTAARERPAMLLSPKVPWLLLCVFWSQLLRITSENEMCVPGRLRHQKEVRYNPTAVLKHLRLNRYRNCWDVLLAGDLQKVRLDCDVILFGLNIFEWSLNRGRKCTSKYDCQNINLLWDWWR